MKGQVMAVKAAEMPEEIWRAVKRMERQYMDNAGVPQSPELTFSPSRETARQEFLSAALDQLVKGAASGLIRSADIYVGGSGLGVSRNATIIGAFPSARAPMSGETVTRVLVNAERKLAADDERTRILTLLNDLRPYDEPYSRREWEIERKGAKEMHAKIVKAIEGLK